MRFTPFALVAVALGACTPERHDGTVAGRVSADSTRIEFAALPSTGGPFEIAPRPDMVIGGLQAHDSLELSTRTAYLPVSSTADGTMIVGDENRLRWYDSAGRLLRTSGRRGFGPGEFSDIESLCPQADSTVVVIDGNGRWSVWSREGTFVESHEGYGHVPPFACTKHSRLLTQVARASAGSTSSRRTATYIVRHIGGDSIGTLSDIPLPEYFAGGIMFEPTLLALDTTVLRADPRRFTFTEVTLSDGRPIRTVVVHTSGTALTQQSYDSIVLASIPRDATPAIRERTLYVAKTRGNPGVLPAFVQTRLDQQARVWLNAPFSHSLWYVLDRRRASLALVRLPAQSTDEVVHLVGFTNRHAVLRSTDEHGATVLRFHALREER